MKPITILLLSCLFLAACDKTGSENNVSCESVSVSLSGDYETDLATSNTLNAEIIALVEDVSANKGSQCYSIAVGAKACGGPERYLVYSSKNVDVDALEAKVCYFNEWRASMNIEYGLVSDCAVAAPPIVELKSGDCTAQ